MSIILGLDLGTTSIKASAFDESGAEIAKASAPNPISMGPDGTGTVPPDDFIATANRCLADIAERVEIRSVAAIGLASAMFSIFPLDSNDQPLGRSLTWIDPQADGKSEKTENLALYQKTGCIYYPQYPRDRIRWINQNQPELFAAAARWVSLAEYLFHAFTGVWAVSRSIASSSGLLDIHTLTWCDEALDWTGIAAGNLNPLTDEVFSSIIKTGPFAGIPLVIGATDGPLCHLGTNSLGSGEMTSTLGTSGAVRLVSSAPVLDSFGRTWCYYLTAGKWVFGAATNAGAVALQWLLSHVLEAGKPLDEMVGQAIANVPPGCEGLSFLPILIGERSPDWKPDIRGAVSGLSLSHTRQHLIRAAMEGSLYRLLCFADILKDLGHGYRRIRATGGYTSAPGWLQMQADMFNYQVEIAEPQEAAAFGAACLASEAAGIVSAEKMAQKAGVRQIFYPNAEFRRAYSEAYQRSSRLYELAKSLVIDEACIPLC